MMATWTERFEVSTVNEFRRWLTDADAPRVCDYHDGNLAEARSEERNPFGWRIVSEVAGAAWKAAENGLVWLFQEDCGDGKAYLAIKAETLVPERLRPRADFGQA